MTIHPEGVNMDDTGWGLVFLPLQKAATHREASGRDCHHAGSTRHRYLGVRRYISFVDALLGHQHAADCACKNQRNK
jgi:hypothetical protein